MINFENGETYIRCIRRHWLFFVVEAGFFVLLAVIPFFVYIIFGENLIPAVNDSGVLDGTLAGFFLFCYSAYLLFLWLGLCLLWTDYHLDVWIITDQRIVDVEQNGLFSRKISEFRLDMIQDVTVVVPNIFAVMCGYGNIRVQTASESSLFNFRNVARPEEMRTLIMGLHHKAVEKQREVTISSDEKIPG